MEKKERGWFMQPSRGECRNAIINKKKSEGCIREIFEGKLFWGETIMEAFFPIQYGLMVHGRTKIRN